VSAGVLKPNVFPRLPLVDAAEADRVLEVKRHGGIYPLGARRVE
jgi:hypothetical protein